MGVMNAFNKFFDDIVVSVFSDGDCEGIGIGGDLVSSLRPPFKRLNSFRRSSDRRPKSILASPDIAPQCEDNGQNKSNNEGPAAWAVSFEKLLECRIGLHTFAEFLKKEFSAENIYFWTACERFKQLPQGAEKTNEAHRIFQQHICIGAPEAVNVDSQARQFVEQSLQDAGNSLFVLAQKQIFNLMKFDSYPRFLKSDLYKQCLTGNIDGPEFDSGLLIQPPNNTPSKLKKSLSNAEDRRRKSLLPWHRKNRSRSKDRGETEYNSRKGDPVDNVTNQVARHCTNELHSSKSSLTSLDLAISSNKGTTKCNEDDLNNVSITRPSLCRVNIGNESTTVVQIRQSETIQQLVSRLLEKRGLSFRTFDVTIEKHSKCMDINESSMKLAGCEVNVAHKIQFKLSLPNQKMISVKSKPSKILNEVLIQVLNRYGFKLHECNVLLGNDLIDINQSVITFEDCTMSIELKECVKVTPAAIPTIKLNNVKVLPSLDEITNRVYKDILQEKSESACLKPKSDKSSVKSEDWGSEHSSGLLGRFLRKDSGVHDRKKKLTNRVKGNSTNSSVEDVNGEHMNGVAKKPLIAKWKPGVKLQVACSESDELYEGLSRAQRSRLEDQRGTEINFELPDFLKDKENNEITPNNRKLRRQEENGIETSRFYISDAILHAKRDRLVKHPKIQTHSNYENRSFISQDNNNSYASNNHNQHTKGNNLKICIPNQFFGSSDESGSSNQSTPTKNSLNITVVENICKSNDSLQNIKSGDPPPLPPKPKILPIKPSNWGQNGFFKSQKDPCPRKECTKQGLYLEQSASSFV